MRTTDRRYTNTTRKQCTEPRVCGEGEMGGELVGCYLFGGVEVRLLRRKRTGTRDYVQSLLHLRRSRASANQSVQD